MSALKPTSDHQTYNLEILLFGCVQLACSKIIEPHSQADRGFIANQGAHFPCYTAWNPLHCSVAKAPFLPTPSIASSSRSTALFFSPSCFITSRLKPPGKGKGREEKYKMNLVQSQFRVPGNLSTKTLQIHLNFHSEIDYEVQIKFCFFQLFFISMLITFLWNWRERSAPLLDAKFNMEMIRSAFAIVAWRASLISPPEIRSTPNHSCRSPSPHRSASLCSNNPLLIFFPNYLFFKLHNQLTLIHYYSTFRNKLPNPRELWSCPLIGGGKIYIYICVCMCVCVCVYICLCVYVCMYVKLVWSQLFSIDFYHFFLLFPKDKSI